MAMTLADAVALEPRVAPAPSLRRNVVWALGGNGVYAACQWAMLVVLAKLGSPEMIGRLSMGFAVCTPLFMLANLQLRATQATDAAGEFAFADYFRLRACTTVAALAVLGTIVLFSGYGHETATVILLVGVAKAFESMSDVLYGALQQRERMDGIAGSLIVKGLLGLLGLAVGVALTGEVVPGAVGVVVAFAVTLVAYDVPLVRRLLPRRARGLGGAIDVRKAARLAWVSLPLALVMTLTSLNLNLPRYVVGRWLGEHALGMFSAMTYLTMVGTTLMGGCFQAASPRLARHFADGNPRAFRSVVRRLTLIGGLVGGLGVVAALVAGRAVLATVYRPEYATQANVLVLLAVVAAVQYMGGALAVAATSLRVFWRQVPVQAASVAAGAVVLAVAVPSVGLAGAAWGLLASAVVSRAGFALLLRPRQVAGGSC
jgi:O-antigen/teichoic acid export membrane protein